MSLHYMSTGGLQGSLKAHNGLHIANGRLNVDNGSGLAFDGSNKLKNTWWTAQAEGDVDMNSNKITNLNDPTSAQEGATKNYVDGWSTIQAQSNVDMNSNKITNLTDPTSAQEGATKNYVDGWSTIQAQSDVDMNSNKITNLADPSSAQDSVTRNYLENGLMTNNLDINNNRIVNASNIPGVSIVTDYGAVGGQDSTQAFNDAIADNDVIFIPPTASPFLLNGGDVTIPSNKTLYGVGNTSQVQLIAKDYGDTANTPVGALNINGSESVVLRDFKVDGNKNDGSLTGNSLLNIECINLDNCRQVYMYRLLLDNAKSEGIDFDECEDCYCVGCQCYNCGGYGIHISVNSKDCELDHCVADNCGHDRSRGGFDVFSSATHSRLSNIKVLDCHKGIHLNGGNSMLTNFRVSGSTFEGLLVEGSNNSISNGRTAVSAQAADTKVIGNQNMLMGIHTNNDIVISGDNNSLVASTYDSISDSGNNNDKIANYEN